MSNGPNGPFLNGETLRQLGLLPYQVKWLSEPNRFKIALWSRQTGKDHTAAAEAVIDCYLRDGAHWLIVAASERQAVETMRKVEAWVSKVRFLFGTRIGFGNLPKVTINKREAWFPTGSRITALPSKPSTIRGFSANLILTEFAFHDDPQKLWEAVFPMLTHAPKGGEKKLRVITTPNGQGTFFHDLWEKWAFYKQKITLHEAREQGLPVDTELLRRGLGNDEAWAQEYECQFTDAASVLLPYELIQSCIQPEASQTSSIDELSRTPCELFLGIDVGRRHDLTVCWVLERSGGKLCTREVLTLKGMPFPDQLAQLAPRVRLARKTCLDATGMGIGLGDTLQQEFGSRVELCSFTSALKEDLFPRVRSAFERGLLAVPNSKTVIEDLHSVQRIVTREGRVTYRAGGSPDGHSDRCTALALALRAADTAPVSVRPKLIGEPMRL